MMYCTMCLSEEGVGRLELQSFVNWHVSAGSWALVFSKSSQSLTIERSL